MENENTSSAARNKRLPLQRFFSVTNTVVEIPPLLQNITSYLPRQEKGELSLLSKEFYTTVSPLFKAESLIEYVVNGRVEKVAALLAKAPEVLMLPLTFSDQAKRLFTNITVFEYAYWAKNIPMCKVLIHFMTLSDKQCAGLSCQKIETKGLEYHQKGIDYCTSHFDFTMVTNALDNYSRRYRDLYLSKNIKQINTLWLAIGWAQRDLPINLIQEYCRTDYAFSESVSDEQLKAFNASEQLSILLNKHDEIGVLRTVIELWFSLRHPFGLGFGFSVFRGEAGRASAMEFCDVGRLHILEKDSNHLKRLDRVTNTAALELQQALAPEPGTPSIHSPSP